MNQPAERETRGLFTIRRIVAIAIVFAGVFLLANGLSKCVDSLCAPADKIPSKWPMSLVQTRLATQFPDRVHGPAIDLAAAAVVLILFFVCIRWLLRRDTINVAAVVLIGLLLTLCTNSIHGPWYGLVYPHQGGTQSDNATHQYYHDAVKVTSAGEFLREFQTKQPELGCHGRTHPPGAVLLFHALIVAVGHGAAISVVIAAVSVGLSGVFMYRLLRYDFDPDTSGHVTLLFLLVPSVQIYYCASLDAIVASCFLGVAVFLRHGDPLRSIAGVIVWLFCASLLTFAACFLGPVVVGFEIITRRTVHRSAAVFLGVAVLYAAMWLLWGFDYWAAFRTAAALENPGGFLLLADPISYVMTRLENVGDILVFFGPFLAVLFALAMRSVSRKDCPELMTLTLLGLLTLAAMFLSGAMRTGETARACLFIYPYLMLPVAAYLDRPGRLEAARRLLPWLVFGQTVAMQTVAGYYW